MSLVRSRDTKPEMLVRRLTHRLGYRYRLHRRDLPGVPDLVFPSRKRVIFVNGCFWHGHNCRFGRMPKSRVTYWEQKIASNRQRDQLNLRRLRGMKWKCLVLWECELKKLDVIASRIVSFLEA
jgi:DNA mismatch endonuclease (patch repair protein)